MLCCDVLFTIESVGPTNQILFAVCWLYLETGCEDRGSSDLHSLGLRE